MGSEGWEEGESEEEADGAASQQVEEREGQEEEEVMSEMKDGAEKAMGKMPCEPSASHPPAKKKRDDGESRPLTSGSPDVLGQLLMLVGRCCAQVTTAGLRVSSQ